MNPLYPYLGATPDGLVKYQCCGDGLIEIKCPYSVKDDHPNALQSKHQTFLNAQGLVSSHKYYTQIQGQLFVTEKLYCDFVVWTPKVRITQRIYPNVNFVEKLSWKLTNFYIDHMLPDISAYESTSSAGIENSAAENSSQQLYCSCQQVEYGKMIMCDNPSCKYLWFHYGCVGIQRAPKSSWFCTDCKNN